IFFTIYWVKESDYTRLKFQFKRIKILNRPSLIQNPPLIYSYISLSGGRIELTLTFLRSLTPSISNSIITPVPQTEQNYPAINQHTPPSPQDFRRTNLMRHL